MKILTLIILSVVSLGWTNSIDSTIDLTVTVNDLRNNTGIVQFALYNKEGTIPDEYYKKYYKMEKATIKSNSAIVVFTNLPKGVYAVNILHDENQNGKIDKGWILPIEGIGFSNFNKIGLSNKPSFSKACFTIIEDIKVGVKIIYM